MAPITTTRTLFELRVGSAHTVEVLLQIRLSDIAWWNSDLYKHERQLHKLIGRRVLPLECRKEIEADRARMQEAANFDAKKKGEVVIGEANLKKKVEKEMGTGSRKRGAGKKGKAKKETKASKKQKLAEKSAKEGSGIDVGVDSKEKKLKLLREPGKWIMGKSIQICYMMEEIEKSSATTLIFRPKQSTVDSSDISFSQSPHEKKSRSSEKGEDDEDKLVPLATFRTWKKLPKRLNLWVFKFDLDDPSDLSITEGGGFPRPEMLPLSDIFRSLGGGED